MSKSRLLLMILIGVYLKSGAQEGYPEVGKPVPGFILESIQNYPTGRVTSEELKGRYVILDFWHRYCASCLMAFPKVDALAKKFEGKLEIFTIGLEDKRGLASLYSQLKKRYNLISPAVFDSVLFNRFVPGKAAPHYIWINPDGVVSAITGGHLQEQDIEAFINGERFDFTDDSYRAKTTKQEVYSPGIPFLHDGNGGTGFQVRYRSLLIPFEPNRMPARVFPLSYRAAARLFQMYGEKVEGIIGLLQLYKFAYLGYASWTINDPMYVDVYPKPVLEMEDTSAFISDYTHGKNVYWYSLILPEERMNEDNVRAVMRSDLSVNFGYHATVEMRTLPYWKVTASDESLRRLQSQGGKRQRIVNEDLSGMTFMNFPFTDLLNNLFYRVYPDQPPIINETGFNGLVNIDLGDGLLTDFDVIKAMLEEHGILLERSIRPFRTLVIKK